MDRSPALDDPRVTFELADRHGRLAGVRLAQEIGLPGPLSFARAGNSWRLALPRPDVDRMEYLFELTDHNGNQATVPDPANPLRAGGAFGDKSVLEFGEYRAPGWLGAPQVPGGTQTLELDAPLLGGTLTATVWAPTSLGDDEPAPLLLVHDGPEYAELGAFTGYLAACVASGALPPVRAALLDPGERNAWYAANPAYSQTLDEVLTAPLRRSLPTTVTVGVGVSLGALAMLHAHRGRAGLLDALLLQSGSFFTPQHDPQEKGFDGYGAITACTAGVHAATTDPRPVPTVITCGTVEENLANNVEMAETLRRLGYPVKTVIVRDAHNYTAWRDALHPHLANLVRDLVGAHAA